MKKEVTNEFKDGLNLDLNPIVTPNTVLTDNLNGTFITYNGNEFCLQNDRGNIFKTELTSGFVPIGIKEHNGVLYIVSVNEFVTEIGTFPGIEDWNIKEGVLDPNYHPLHNLSIESEVYVIYSAWDNDELNEEDITIDNNACIEVISRYNGIYSEGYFGSLFTDKGHNYVYFNSEEDRNNCYIELSALYDIFRQGTEIIDTESLFNAPLNYDLEHPVTIEIQDSYDGSVNLILIDDKNKPRIINSGFSVEPENKYKIIDRNQTAKTNWYDDLIQTELIRTSNIITNFELNGVQSGGQLKGGNYTFYLKFGDADYNQTDVVAESGIVSIFKGNDGVPRTISGTLLDERTDKMISLKITGLNLSYSKLYIYYIREYSDTQGYRMTESGMFTEPIDIRDNRTEEEKDPESNDFCEPYQNIWLSGFEQTQSINIEELNIDYHTIDFARAEAQHSNMLFLGNVGQKETFDLYKTLKDYSLSDNISTEWVQEGSIGYVDTATFTSDSKDTSEYYSVNNIYDKVGYWPNEYYRFGIVYILKDGSTTPVFNIRGDNDNEYGVFKTPDLQVLTNDSVNPIGLKIVVNNLPEEVIGYFVVRQKRIPLTICQGLAIGIDKVSHTPVVYNGSNWIIESFLSHYREDFIEPKAYKHGAEEERTNPKLIYNDISSIANNYTGSRPKVDEEKYNYIFLQEYSQSYSIPSNSSITCGDIFQQAFDDINQWKLDNNVSTVEELTDIDDPEIESISLYQYSSTLTIYKVAAQSDGENWTILNNLYVAVYIDNRNIHWNENYNNKLVYITTNSEDIEASIATAISINNQQIVLNDTTVEDKKFIKIESSGMDTWGLISLDPCVNPNVKSILDGSEFNIIPEYGTVATKHGVIVSNDIDNTIKESETARCAFISSNTNVKVIGKYSYSTVAGSASNVKGRPVSKAYYLKTSGDNGVIPDPSQDGTVYYYSGTTEDYLNTKDRHTNLDLNTNINLIRGKFVPYIGITSAFNNQSGIYSIRNNDINNAYSIRDNDNSPYYTISKRLNKESDNKNIIYRGDCFSCTIGMRILSNFIDPTAPVSDEILDPWSWNRYVSSRVLTASNDDHIVKYDSVNLSDVNTVSLGYWVTFKCLSSYNLGLRSVDPFHTDEMALLGSPRSFYPLNGASTATGNKIEESFLLNDGYSATVGEKRYNLLPDVPYSKSEFENRIMFSNVHITDAFTNGYRTFQGLSYKDYDKQYGAITKLVSYGQNIFIVMEHGLGLVSVNPKALMQTTTGEAIHIYGHGVLPDEMTIISQDYGSKYEHSVVRTPIGIYGIDVDAKKIWRFSDKQGFETFSDMKIETLLKDCLEPFDVEMSISDVRTHYNAFKGDLMFTWYITKQLEGETIKYLWNICYNERQNVWVTRYGWVPIISENINDNFYSLQYDESNYNDTVRIWSHTPDSKLELPNPTNWYNRQHPFEFEFVVSDPIGINKIFDNLQIISNNTQPNELEIAVIGDSYIAKRKPIVPTEERTWDTAINTETVLTTSNIHPGNIYGDFKYDWRLNENLFVKLQEFKDIYKFGRRMGNIHYRDGIWYSNIEPILLKRDENDPGKQARIRDKWARIRIRYTGEDIAVITAIRTLINI